MSAHWAMRTAKKLSIVLAKYERQELVLAGMLLLVIAGVFGWSMYMLLSEDEPAAKPVEEDKATLESDARSFEEMLEKESHRELMSGSCAKYTWTQKNDELEMFVHLDGLEDSEENRLSKKEVEVGFRPRGLAVRVRGQTLVEGSFFAEVDPDECNWQFYSEARISLSDASFAPRKIWITLTKKKLALQVKDFWKYVLECDYVQKTTTSGAPVFSISSGDDMKRAMQALRKNKKES